MKLFGSDTNSGMIRNEFQFETFARGRTRSTFKTKKNYFYLKMSKRIFFFSILKIEGTIFSIKLK